MSGRDPRAEIYSAHTLRRARVLETGARVICADGTRQHFFVGLANKEIQIYTIKQMELVRTLNTLQPPTTFSILQEKLLIYGLGDEGYGCVFIKEDFRMFESNSGKEKYKRSVAKTSMIASFNQDGFIWKVGGYTALTGGYTKKTQGKKKTACFVTSLRE